MIADDAPLWMIGCGTMGGAMLRRWLHAGRSPSTMTVVTRGEADLPAGVRHLRALPLDEEPGTVVLAVKPQQLDAVTPMLASVRPPLLLSILAGAEEGSLAARIAAGAIVRAMPNLPVAIGEGVTALYSRSAGEAERAAAVALARPLGLVEWISDEAQFDAVTALAGSGPAFVFRFVDALASGAEALGIDPAQARRLAAATVRGAASMAATADVPPAVLADRVASRGGSTRAGLDVLDADGALDRLVAATLAASARRNAELADAAR